MDFNNLGLNCIDLRQSFYEHTSEHRELQKQGKMPTIKVYTDQDIIFEDAEVETPVTEIFSGDEDSYYFLFLRFFDKKEQEVKEFLCLLFTFLYCTCFYNYRDVLETRAFFMVPKDFYEKFETFALGEISYSNLPIPAASLKDLFNKCAYLKNPWDLRYPMKVTKFLHYRKNFTNFFKIMCVSTCLPLTLSAFPLNQDVCVVDPHPIFQQCQYFQVIPGFSFNLWVDEDTSTYFTTCKYLEYEQEIVYNTFLTCWDLNFTSTVPVGSPMTGDGSTCYITGNCTSNPESYCSYHSIVETPYCYHSLLTQTKSLITKESTLSGGLIFTDIQPFTGVFNPINEHNLHYKLKDRTIYLVLPYHGLFNLVLHTPFETITTQVNSDVMKFSFPESYSGRTFGFHMKLYDESNNLIYENSDLLKTDDFCSDPSCYFCKRAFDNFNCLPGINKFLLVFSTIITILIGSLLIMLLAFCCFTIMRKLSCFLKRFRNKNILPENKNTEQNSGSFKEKITNLFSSEISRNINLYKNSSTYSPSYSPEVNNSLFIQFLKNNKITLRNPKSSYMMYFMLFCIFIQCVSSQCNHGVSIDSTVTLCNTVTESSQVCTVEFSTTMTLDRLFYTSCFTVKDQSGHSIGSLRIGYLSAYYYIYYNIDYFTVPWSGISQSNFRCYNAINGYCNSDYCQSPNRTAYGNLDDPYLMTSYGQTNCDRVSPSTSNCFFSTNGCLYSGWGIVPEANRLNAVFSQSTTSDVFVDLFYEFLIYETRTFGNMTATVGQVIEIDNIGIDGVVTIDINTAPFPDPNTRLSRISFPSLHLDDVINPPGVYQSEKIGDVQASTPAPFLYPSQSSGIESQHNSIISSKVIHGHNVDYTFHNNGIDHNANSEKLPIEINHQNYKAVSTSDNPNDFQYVLAEFTNPPGIELTIYTQFQVEKLIESCTFDITINGVTGCCDCSTHAMIDYSVEYISDSYCNILFTSNDVSILNPFNSEIAGIIFATDTCQQDILIKASSGSFNQDLRISISLEHAVVQSFSDGLTTIEEITSFEYSSEGDLRDLVPSFFSKFNKHNVIHWAMLFFIAIIGLLVLALVAYCFVQCLLILIHKTIKSHKHN